MAKITFKIPQKIQKLLFTLVGTSWFTGILFFVLKTWFIVEGEFGPEKHPWQFPTLMIHAASAFLIMILYGALLITHVPSSWKLNRMRVLGISLITVVAFQIISAYLLYYLANEQIRDIVEYLHLGAGFTLPFILTAHIIIGVKSGKRYKKE